KADEVEAKDKKPAKPAKADKVNAPVKVDAAKPEKPGKGGKPAGKKGKWGKKTKEELAAIDAEVAEIEAEIKRKPKKVKPGSALVVVESPAKAKTIGKYLGAGYVVKASVGHVRDLPKSKIGVDFENNFEPSYEVLEGKKKVVAEIRKA